MNKEYKELLLRDLCARLPDGVILDYSFIEDKQRIHTKMPLTYRNIGTVALDEWHTNEEIFKPYLRRLSSMTEEEKREYQAFFNYDGVEYPEEYIDWLNKKMFAYRTIDGKDMFELGLALEAPEGMYK